jgi:thiosulfate dehydrogenase [quinone] large subunit
MGQIHAMLYRSCAEKRRIQMKTKAIQLESWRVKGLAVVRIVLGVIWAINAWLKWQPDFIQNFTGYLSEAAQDQPQAVVSWINFWQGIVQANPTAFAVMIALLETALAISLIFGLFSNVGYIGGALLSLMIWTVAEGFGGPYGPGATDIGSAIIYIPALLALFFASAGHYWGVDSWLAPKLGRWAFLASGSPAKVK